MGFKQAEHLLLRGDLLAFQDTAARLGKHALDQREEVVHLVSEVLGEVVTSSAQRLAHPLRLLSQLFRRLHPVLLALALLLKLLLPCAPEEPMPALSDATRTKHSAAAYLSHLAASLGQ